MGRRLFRAAALATVLAAIPTAVLAHPLGNFTINHYAGITVEADAIRLDIVIDRAEIPTFQERRHIDADEDGQVSDAEIAAAVGPRCEELAADLRLVVDGSPVVLEGRRSALTFPSGLGGLPTMRLECAFSAPLRLAPTEPTTIEFVDASDVERVGWREIVVAGAGAIVDAGELPLTSVSERLTAYPEDLLAQPLADRSATIVARADPSSGTASGVPGDDRGGDAVSAVPGGVAGEVPAIFSSTNLTPLVLLVSLGLAAVLGAQHALTPGHGKTLMAAYLVGSRGRASHAVGLGLAVSVSHTLGILLLTAVVIGAQGVIPAETVIEAAPFVAAVTIVGVGLWMLAAEIRRRARLGTATGHGHAHGSGHVHAAKEHRHDAAPEHSHGGFTHSHMPAADGALGWRGLFALGLAGGLIPSTSALLILLGSIVAGRPAFGFVLVVAFGLGMAAVMTAIGLAVVHGRARIERASASPRLQRLAAAAPLAAAVMVLGVGLFLTAQAVVGSAVL